jgi:hypothetical protein
MQKRSVAEKLLFIERRVNELKPPHRAIPKLLEPTFEWAALRRLKAWLLGAENTLLPCPHYPAQLRTRLKWELDWPGGLTEDEQKDLWEAIAGILFRWLVELHREDDPLPPDALPDVTQAWVERRDADPYRAFFLGCPPQVITPLCHSRNCFLNARGLPDPRRQSGGELEYEQRLAWDEWLDEQGLDPKHKHDPALLAALKIRTDSYLSKHTYHPPLGVHLAAGKYDNFDEVE